MATQEMSVWDGNKKLLSTDDVWIALAHVSTTGQIRVGRTVLFDAVKDGGDDIYTRANWNLVWERRIAAGQASAIQRTKKQQAAKSGK